MKREHGETHKEIAFEKGGIIKENIPVVIGEYQRSVMPVFEEIAKPLMAPVFVAEHLVKDSCPTDLLGDYQQKNCKTAIQSLRLLRDHNFNLSDEQIRQGLLHVTSNTGLKGRWQLLGSHPKIVCDTAHNKEGLTIVMEQLSKEKYDHLHIVMAVKICGTVNSFI